MKKKILLSTIIVALFSCNSIENSFKVSDSHYFSGSYILQSDSSKLDSARFVDCATNVSYEVRNTKISRRIKRSYLMLTTTPKQPLFVEFRGKITKDSLTKLELVQVDSLIGFSVGSRCDNDDLIVGVYESTSESGRSVLRLKSDYTYTQDIYNSDHTELNISGVWFKNAKLELILQQKVPNYLHEKGSLSFEVIPAQSSLAENGGDRPLVYKKVYL